MKKVVATGKTSLSNNIEMHVGPTPPLYPVEGQLWLNTSTVPPSLWRWDGEKWVLQEMDVEKLDPDLVQGIEDKIEDLHQKVLDEVAQIDEEAAKLKADVEARNKQDDKYFADMRQNIIDNRYEALGWYEENDGRISGIAQSVDGITTRVGKAETNISTLTQTAQGLQSTVTSITNGTHSVITQMSDRINLRVEKDKIVSQINASPEGIYIAGKLIYLDGNVKVDGTFVSPNIISKGTDANGRDNYTQITGMKMTSYGYYENTWRGGYRVGYHALTAMSGYIKMQQMTGVNGSTISSRPALYYTSRGIGTRMDGSGDNDASGVIEFFAQGYSSSSNSLAFASSGNIILESTYSTGSNIFLNPNGAQVHVCDKWMINYYDVVCGTLSASTLKAGQFYTNTTNLNSTSGAIKIGGITGNINTDGDVTCYKVVETSRRDLKKNIEAYEDSALDVIDSAAIKKYQYKKDVDDVDLPYIGLILDEAPLEVVDTKGEGVLPTTGVWIAWKAIQELNARIKELEGTA